MEPAPQSAIPVMLISAVPPDGLPPEHLTAALEELKAAGEGGGRIAGYPLMKLKVTVLGGQWNAEQTDARAMKIAAADAFDKGLEQGGKVLLEPIMKLDIVTPEDYLGDFIGDLQQRRAVIAKTENRGKMAVIEAHAPLKELFGYSGAMRSLSQGRASSSIEPLKYEPAPAEVLKAFDI
jgi:elongation factor G